MCKGVLLVLCVGAVGCVSEPLEQTDPKWASFDGFEIERVVRRPQGAGVANTLCWDITRDEQGSWFPGALPSGDQWQAVRASGRDDVDPVVDDEFVATTADVLVISADGAVHVAVPQYGAFAYRCIRVKKTTS